MYSSIPLYRCPECKRDSLNLEDREKITSEENRAAQDILNYCYKQLLVWARPRVKNPGASKEHFESGVRTAMGWLIDHIEKDYFPD